MSRRITKIVLSCACLIGATLPVWGQQQAAGSTGILGRLNPRTGSFRPAQRPLIDDAAAEAATDATGKLVFNITITIASTIPAASVITCNAAAYVVDNLNDTTFTFLAITKDATVVATRSGSTAQCTVTIPYSWKLITASADTISPSIQIQALDEATNPAARTVIEGTLDQDLSDIKVPAAVGATTTETVAVTL